jgi:hypothetical protein
MQGADALLNINKMILLNTTHIRFIATDTYPALVPFVCEWFKIAVTTDAHYNPKSSNPQSGIAVAEAIGTWKKVFETITKEEVNSISVTVEESPKLAKCKEFLMVATFPKTETDLKLGTSRAAFNRDDICFYSGTTNTASNYEYEQRALISIIGNEISSIMTVGAPAGLKQAAYMNCGRRIIKADIYKFVYGLVTLENRLPIGTKFVLYGKVEG